MAQLLTSTEQTFASGAGGWTGGTVVSGRFVVTPDAAAQASITKSATAGNSYTAAADIYTGFWDEAAVVVRFLSASSTVLAQSITAITGYTRHSVTATAPTGSTSVVMLVTANSYEDIAEITFDNASLDESVPSGITGTGAATTSATASATGTASSIGAAAATTTATTAATGTAAANGAGASATTATSASTGTSSATGTGSASTAAATAATGTVSANGAATATTDATGSAAGNGSSVAVGAATTDATAVATGTIGSPDDVYGWGTLTSTRPTSTLATIAPTVVLACTVPSVVLATTAPTATLTTSSASVTLTTTRETP